MRRFRLKRRCGNHIEHDKEGKSVIYKAGDTVPSDRDLVALFPDKFELISGQDLGSVATAPKIPKSLKKKRKAKTTVVSETKTPESEHGIDVTKSFPTASEVELKVFEKSKWFTVVDPDDNEVLNDKKLRRSGVKDFLKDYLQDDEDNDEDVEEEEEEDDEED